MKSALPGNYSRSGLQIISRVGGQFIPVLLLWGRKSAYERCMILGNGIENKLREEGLM